MAISDAKLKQVAMIDLPGDPGFSQVALANGQVVITHVPSWFSTGECSIVPGDVITPIAF